MAIKGLIFDFDGLIVNTEIPLFNVYKKLFNQHGFPYSYKNWWRTIGSGPKTDDPAKYLADLIHEPEKADSIREFAAEKAKEVIDELPAFPGVAEFIESAYNLEIPLAIASSSGRDWVEHFLNRLSLTRYFNQIVTCDDVDHVKPEPDLYLLALKKLEISADEAIVFEDSPNGIKAAKAAGIYCIAVPNEITREMPIQIADQVVESFLQLSPASLINGSSTN